MHRISPHPVALALLGLSIAGPGSAAPAEPQPPAIRAASAITLPLSGPRIVTQRETAPVRPVQVTMTLGQTMLWRGTLNVGGGQEARVSLFEPVPSSEACQSPEARSARRQIELSISNERWRQEQEGYTLSARYTRPPADGACNGTRMVSIEQRFSLADRPSLRFEGDGGLKVTISSD